MSDERGQLRRVGAMWKPRAGSKSLGSGSVTVNEMKQRFIVLRNDRKPETSQQPDYWLVSSDQPETDEYAERQAPRPESESPESTAGCSVLSLGDRV